MGADCAETTGRARRQLLAPQYSRAVLGRLFRMARGPAALRPAIPRQTRRFESKRPQAPGNRGPLDLHHGLAGRLVLRGWDNHFLTIGWRMGLKHRPRPETITPRIEA